jgi:hypothetical protein
LVEPIVEFDGLTRQVSVGSCYVSALTPRCPASEFPTNGGEPRGKSLGSPQITKITTSHRKRFLGNIFRQVMVRQPAIRNRYRFRVMPSVKLAKPLNIPAACRVDQFSVGAVHYFSVCVQNRRGDREPPLN